MQIYVHTDNNIDGSGELTAYVERKVADALSRFSDHITRIEVHLSDESGGRATGADIRCMRGATGGSDAGHRDRERGQRGRGTHGRHPPAEPPAGEP